MNLGHVDVLPSLLAKLVASNPEKQKNNILCTVSTYVYDMYMCMYMYVYIYTYIYIFLYI